MLVEPSILPSMILLVVAVAVAVASAFIVIRNTRKEKRSAAVNYVLAAVNAAVMSFTIVSLVLMSSSVSKTSDEMITELTAQLGDTSEGCAVVSAADEETVNRVADCEDVVAIDGAVIQTLADSKEYRVEYDENPLIGTRINIKETD